MIEIPFKAEHSARVAAPSKFLKSTFRRKKISSGVTIIVAKPKGSGTAGPMKVQSYRFGVCYFSPSEAKRWLKRNKVKPIEFEPARGKCIRRRGA